MVANFPTKNSRSIIILLLLFSFCLIEFFPNKQKHPIDWHILRSINSNHFLHKTICQRIDEFSYQYCVVDFSLFIILYEIIKKNEVERRNHEFFSTRNIYFSLIFSFWWHYLFQLNININRSLSNDFIHQSISNSIVDYISDLQSHHG